METTKPQAFVMIPYRDEFDGVLELSINPGLVNAGVEPVASRDEVTGPIFEHIQRSIERAKLCIADVSGGNPNVMWEAAYAHALGKPVVFIARGDPGSIPFDVRHNGCFMYDPQSEVSLDELKGKIERAVKRLLEGQASDVQAIRQILLPNSIKDSSASFVVAANPLSWRTVSRSDTGWRERRATTFSDYAGIRGLMRAFGVVLGMQVLPELVNPDDFADDVTSRPTHFYLIGSPKANRWTGFFMEKFFANLGTKWDFGPDPDSKYIWNPRVILRENGRPHNPTGWLDNKDRTFKDFGIVLRGPNPHDASTMFTIMAGRSALGTEAAAYAVTDPNCVRALIDALQFRKIPLEDHRNSFLAVVSLECQKEAGEIRTDIDSFTVWEVAKFH